MRITGNRRRQIAALGYLAAGIPSITLSMRNGHAERSDTVVGIVVGHGGGRRASALASKPGLLLTRFFMTT